MNHKFSIPKIRETLKQIFMVRWKPNQDLIAVAVSLLLVIAGISCTTHIAGQQDWGGVPYFIIYAVFTVALCGIGLPLHLLYLQAGFFSPARDYVILLHSVFGE